MQFFYSYFIIFDMLIGILFKIVHWFFESKSFLVLKLFRYDFYFIFN